MDSKKLIALVRSAIKVLKKKISFKGQSLMEFAVLLALVGLAFMAMQIYIQRGIQGKTKDLTDVIINPEKLPLRAYTAESQTSSDTTVFKGTTTVSTGKGGAGTKTVDETTTTTSSSMSVDKI